MKLKSKKSPGWGVDRSGGLSGSKNPECKRCTIIVHASCPKSRLHYVCSKYVVLYGHEIGAACRTIACMAMVCERDACSTVVAAPQLQLMSAKAGSGVAELVTRYSRAEPSGLSSCPRRHAAAPHRSSLPRLRARRLSPYFTRSVALASFCLGPVLVRALASHNFELDPEQKGSARIMPTSTPRCLQF